MKKLLLLFSLCVLLSFDNLSQDTLSTVAKEYFYKAFNSSDYNYQIVNYTKCLEINPQHAKTHYNRALAYYNLGNKKLAIDDFTKSIEINPQHANSYYARGGRALLGMCIVK